MIIREESKAGDPVRYQDDLFLTFERLEALTIFANYDVWEDLARVDHNTKFDHELVSANNPDDGRSLSEKMQLRRLRLLAIHQCTFRRDLYIPPGSDDSVVGWGDPGFMGRMREMLCIRRDAGIPLRKLCIGATGGFTQDDVVMLGEYVEEVTWSGDGYESD